MPQDRHRNDGSIYVGHLPERLSIPTLKPPAGDVMQRRIEHATTAIIKERKSQLKLTMAGACSK